MNNITLVFITVFYLVLFQTEILSQEYCEPDYILPLLNSEIDHERNKAVNLIASCNSIDLLEDLENSYFNEERFYIKENMLLTIYKLNSPNTHDLVYDFLASLDELEKSILDDERYSRLVVTKILFDLGDYSTHQYVFDFVETRFEIPAIVAIQMLSRIIEQLPQFAGTAKIKLENYSKNSTLQNMRAMAITFLVHHYGSEYVNDCISKFYDDESYIVRNTAFQLLSSLKVANLNSMLKERLTQDPNWSLRVLISDSLLKKYGEPTDLKAVVDYQPYEPDETARSLMAYSINHFVPPKPGNLGYDQMILQLISFTEELFQYEWIKEEEVYIYYYDKLNELRETIENGYIEEACGLIQEDLLDKIEVDFQSYGTLTIEGYKFLHYHTIYIKEDFEQEFGPCTQL